jgi:hypothetical protein
VWGGEISKETATGIHKENILEDNIKVDLTEGGCEDTKCTIANGGM